MCPGGIPEAPFVGPRSTPVGGIVKPLSSPLPRRSIQLLTRTIGIPGTERGEGLRTMSDCECLAGCPFFNDKMEGMPSMAHIYKDRYCHADCFSCARYQVFKALGRESVPSDLFPNQVDRAHDVIAVSQAS
jgi:hypothetical protein